MYVSYEENMNDERQYIPKKSLNMCVKNEEALRMLRPEIGLGTGKGQHYVIRSCITCTIPLGFLIN
jgi:hypothetical protein